MGSGVKERSEGKEGLTFFAKKVTKKTPVSPGL
jgi:hypothetical protein